MRKSQHGWRAIALICTVALLLASTPALAQAPTASGTDPSWIEWAIAQVAQLWQLVAGGVSPDGGGEQPSPIP